MGDKNRFSKPVAFNNKNEKDQAILKHVSRRNFSGYVKKLIWEDMKAKTQNAAVEPLDEVNELFIEEPIERAETAAERIERIKRKVASQQPNKLD